ncbi:MAG: flagellar hook-length control protein FliK [Actinomycetota bacterium]
MRAGLPVNPPPAAARPAPPVSRPQSQNQPQPQPISYGAQEPVLDFAAAMSVLDTLDDPAAGEATPAAPESAAADTPEAATEMAAMPVSPATVLAALAPMFGMVPAGMEKPVREAGAEGAPSAPGMAVPAAGAARASTGGGIVARLAALAGAPEPSSPRPTDLPAGQRPAELQVAQRPAEVAVFPLDTATLQPGTDSTLTAEPAPAVAPANAQATTGVSAPAAALSPAGTDPAAASAVKLAGTPEQWRRPLMEALGERIRFQVGSRSEHAVIRLDPPMMGSIEVVIRHQGGVLQVQLSASNGEVVRQLQGISDSLHQDLAQRQYTDVSVQVFADGRDGSGRQRPDQTPEDKRPGRALAEAEAGSPTSPFVLSLDRD